MIASLPSEKSISLLFSPSHSAKFDSKFDLSISDIFNRLFDSSFNSRSVTLFEHRRFATRFQIWTRSFIFTHKLSIQCHKKRSLFLKIEHHSLIPKKFRVHETNFFFFVSNSNFQIRTVTFSEIINKCHIRFSARSRALHPKSASIKRWFINENCPRDPLAYIKFRKRTHTTLSKCGLSLTHRTCSECCLKLECTVQALFEAMRQSRSWENLKKKWSGFAAFSKCHCQIFFYFLMRY